MGDSSGQRPRRPGLRSETHDEEQSEAVWPQFIHHDANKFRTEQHVFNNIREEIMNAKFPTEITYHSVRPDWGALIADYIDKHQDTEAIKAKISFNNIAAKLVIRITPTRLHACHNEWYILLRNIRMFTDNTQERFAAPYANSRKIPDLCVMPDNQYHPSLVIEVGWSESHERPMEDMRLWMNGGYSHVKIVLIIEFAKKANTNQVTGKAELYIRDAAGNPYCSQQAILFPANLTGTSLYVTAGDLFGNALPAGVAANTRLPWSIDLLRREARAALVHMGLVEAI